MSLLLALLACTMDGPIVCTELFAFSVSATVASTSGAALSEVAGTYTVDGGAETPCQDFSGGQLVCGGEEAGHFVITVTAAGHEPQTQEVDVAADECHVISESLQFVLEPSACTEEELPAVWVKVVDDVGNKLTAAQVTWVDPATDMHPAPCDQLLADGWGCAPEQIGEITVAASLDGYAADEATVTTALAADGCHVDTAEVTLVLSAMEL